MASDLMVTCSIDNVLSMFDFKNHEGPSARLKEEDLIDGAYSSTQPMIDCGFVTSEILYAVTSINTVEFIRMSDANKFLTIASVSLALIKALIVLKWLLVPPRCDVPDRGRSSYRHVRCRATLQSASLRR